MTVFDIIRSTDRRIIDAIGGSAKFRKLARALIGTVPGVATLVMTVHVGLLLLGFNFGFAAILFEYALIWFLLLTILSISFEFCWVHRAFCAYNLIISQCIEYQEHFGFGCYLTPARWLALLLGVFLLYAFIRERCWRTFTDKINNQI